MHGMDSGRAEVRKKATARGIKIGASKTKVQKAYGELTWKKCTSKDPFSKMKGLKTVSYTHLDVYKRQV